MRRLLTRTALVTVLAPALLALPTVTLPASAARPVAPQVLELPVSGVDAVAAAEAQGQAGQLSAASSRRTVALTPRRATEPFRMVGVTWNPSPAAGEVEVWVRTRSAGAWSDWQELGGLADEEPDAAEASGARPGTSPLWVDHADGVQVRVELVSGQAPQGLRVALVDPGTSPADAPATTALSSASASELPAVRSRAQWGADESLRSGSPSYASELKAVTLHHTASSNSYSQSDVPALIRGFYAYHTKSNGWSDIGYNFLVDKYGTTWEGRAGGIDRAVIGAHAGGFNTSTAGVSIIGTYDTVAPTAASLDAVSRLTAWKLGAAGHDPKGTVRLTSAGSTRYPKGTAVTLPRVFGHSDVSKTACPGKQGYSALPGIRSSAAAMAGSYSPESYVPPVAASSSQAGVVDVVSRTASGAVTHRELTTQDITTPAAIGGVGDQTPTSASRARGALAVVGRGADGSAQITGREADGSWAAWTSLGGQLGARPALVSDNQGRLDVLVRGSNGSLYQKVSTGPGRWSGWVNLGGRLLPEAGPTGVWTAGGRFQVVVVGVDRSVWRKQWAPYTGWSAWQDLGGQTAGDLNAVSAVGEQVTLALRGLNDVGYVRTIDAASDTGWRSVGGVLTTPVAAAATPGSGTVTLLARGTNLALYRSTGAAGSFTAWQRVA